MRYIGPHLFMKIRLTSKLGAIPSAFLVRIASAVANFGCIALLYRVLGEDSAGGVLVALSCAVLIATMMRFGQRQTTLAKVIEADRVSTSLGQEVLWSSLCVVVIGCAVGALMCIVFFETELSVVLIAATLAISVTVGEGLRARRSFVAGTAMDQSFALGIALFALLFVFLSHQVITEDSALNIFTVAFAIVMFCALAVAVLEFGVPSVRTFHHIPSLCRSGAAHLAVNLSNVMMLHGPVVLLGVAADSLTAGHMAVVMKIQSFALLPGAVLALGAGPRIAEYLSTRASPVDALEMQKMSINAAIATCGVVILFFFLGENLLIMLVGQAPHELFLSALLLLLGATVQTGTSLATAHLVYSGESLFVVGARLLVLLGFGAFIYLQDCSLLSSSVTLALLGIIASILQLRRSGVVMRRDAGEVRCDRI